MNSFSADDLKRESIVSSSSKESDDSQLSVVLHRSKFHFNSLVDQMENNLAKKTFNEESKEKMSCSEQFLFFGPLILCLILLISGIIVFIIVEQRNTKDKNDFIGFNPSNHTYVPIVCPFKQQSKEDEFALNQLNCALHYSSIIHISYSKNLRLINPGENLTIKDVLIPPIIQLNKEFLSKINTKSFVLILIDPIHVPTFLHVVILHWIRYYSLSLEDEEDICYYRSMDHRHIHNIQKIFLLYATNSSQIMIRAKTICNQIVDPFQLTEYITFIQLKLIASTNFFIPYVETSDE